MIYNNGKISYQRLIDGLTINVRCCNIISIGDNIKYIAISASVNNMTKHYISIHEYDIN